MRNADKMLSFPKLAKDDCFTFGCNQCGVCCRNRDDILLTPLDLYKIAKHFGKSTDEILVEYCTVHEGEVSKLPCILIKPLEYRKTCPFLGKHGCEIHSAKPAVCALFPLGWMTNTETKELTYFVQPINCGNKRQTQTVQEWLGEFSMIEEEAFNILWHEKIMELVAIIKNKTQCLKCGDIIESTYTHDYRKCSCGALAVDGGLDYIRRTFSDPSICKELSEHEYECGDKNFDLKEGDST